MEVTKKMGRKEIGYKYISSKLTKCFHESIKLKQYVSVSTI